MFQSARAKLGLVNSQLFDEHEFFKAMSTDIKSANRSILIESPFITLRRAIEFSNLCHNIIVKGVVVSVHTRNPNHHDGNLRDQALMGIKYLQEAGIRVIAHNDLRHRKIAIVDKDILWEGSLNMLSHSNSREIMRRTHSKDLVNQMLKFI